MSVGKAENGHQGATVEKRIDQVLALIWVVVGIIVLIQNQDLRYMAQYGPGPGFLTFWLGLGFILLGIALLVQVTLRRPEEDGQIFSLPGSHAAWQMFFVMVGFFVFVFLSDRAGFLLSIGLLFFFLLCVVERKGWKFSLFIAGISTAAFWAIFELGLQLRLPLGFLE